MNDFSKSNRMIKELQIMKIMHGLSDISGNSWTLREAKELGYVALANGFWLLTPEGEEFLKQQTQITTEIERD